MCKRRKCIEYGQPSDIPVVLLSDVAANHNCQRCHSNSLVVDMVCNLSNRGEFCDISVTVRFSRVRVKIRVSIERSFAPNAMHCSAGHIASFSPHHAAYINILLQHTRHHAAL